MMPHSVLKSMVRWCNQGNPSSGYKSAHDARNMMEEFREYIGNLCKFDPCCREDRDLDESGLRDKSIRKEDLSQYKIIFTSGASESNCTVLSSIVLSYSLIKQVLPHIIMSAIEHKSLYSMAEDYQNRGLVTVSFIQPTPSGHIRPIDIETAIMENENVCGVFVMHANNETGAINDIEAIGKLSHSHNIPFHCDIVQSFGKFRIDPTLNNIDSMSISFHKMGGPPGIGALVIKQRLLRGFQLSPMIFGTQNEGLRGGTENLPGIGASFEALKIAMANRVEKNIMIQSIRDWIMTELGKYFTTKRYTTYYKERNNNNNVEIIFLSGPSKYYLLNTILLSVIKPKPYICNTQMKDDLAERGFIVSVGSACNTSSPKASHVLYAMGADDYIRKGALRISLGDTNTFAEAEKFVIAMVEVIKRQLKSVQK